MLINYISVSSCLDNFFWMTLPLQGKRLFCLLALPLDGVKCWGFGVRRLLVILCHEVGLP